MSRPLSEVEAKILHPSRWGRLPTERERGLVQQLKLADKVELLWDPAVLDEFRSQCERWTRK